MASGEALRDWLLGLHGEVLSWCEGRRWIWRAPLLVFFAYIAVRHLADPLYTSIFGGINLGIHELGHVVFNTTAASPALSPVARTSHDTGWYQSRGVSCRTTTSRPASGARTSAR